MSLFRGNERSYGRYYRQGKMETIKDQVPTINDFEMHLDGELGIGIVPVMDDGMCYFGAIDVDAHGDLPDIDLLALEKRVRENDLPLSVCRSKSGGAHLYLFGAEPLRASLVRTALSKWAEILGHGGCEIFPKQSKLLTNDDGTQALGNWINLCYFDANNTDQLRYSFEGGKQVPLNYFVDLAESRKITGPVLVERSDTDHGGAPPCIQKIISQGVPMDQRNQALFNLGVYLKQAYPETWKDKAFDLNAKFEVPLDHAGSKKTIASVGRRDYRYKCKEEPCKSLCNSRVCVTRKFGITQEENNELTLGKPPVFKNLRKITTDPVRWLLEVDELDITLSTIELLDFRKVRDAIADRLTKLVAAMKNAQWQVILYPLMEKATVIEAPETASTSGIIKAKLNTFIQKADFNSDGHDIKERQALLHGAPVVQYRKEDNINDRVVYFQGEAFDEYLRKSRCADIKGAALWMILSNAGVRHTKLYITNSKSINIWYVLITPENNIEYSKVEIPNEF